MALNKETVERLLNKLDDLQKQIESIHNELLIELDRDEDDDLEMTEEEIAEIKAIREENDYRTLEEWRKEEVK
jgi:hypothetical protein